MIIAIDGPAGSGKSTTARAVAQRLGVPYLDTGAMYRAVAWAVLAEGVDPADSDTLGALADRLRIELDPDGTVRVDGNDVTAAIRGPEVSGLVSVIAAHPGVRRAMVAVQRVWAQKNGGGVVEGRDIGSVVFPDAEVKVYLTARPEVRAQRRAAQVGEVDPATIAAWAANLAERDRLDSTRAESPLVQATGSVALDTSDLSLDEVVERIAELAK